MSRTTLLNTTKVSVAIVGGLAVGLSIWTLPATSINVGFLTLLVFSLLIAPRMSLVIPRSNVAISFSDTVVFLSFLLYGPESAVIMAAMETLANCLYYRWKGTIDFGRYMIPVNTLAAGLFTALACATWAFLFYVFPNALSFQSNTRGLLVTLGVLALVQFIASTIFAAMILTLKDGVDFWTTWKKDCFSSSTSQFVGAGSAGVLFKILNYGDFVSGVVALGVFGIVYLTYRQSIQEINTSALKAEDAERQKAEIERERRLEAERYAAELGRSLVQEERANEALRKSEKDFQHAALHDSLTGLPNRKHLGDVLRSLILKYSDDPAVPFQVLFLDIRSFKNINDSLGHTIGDKVLMIAAKRFARLVNPGDIVARIGGDEFAIVLRNLSTAAKAQKVARKIHRSLTQPFSLSGNKITIDLSIGIAPCDTEYDTPEEILRDADIAMHYAKERNDGPAVFTKELRARFLERVRFEMDLRSAIDRNELSMHYQPIVSLSDGRLVGFEALLRWHHSEFGNIPPNKFIPIAENSGLIQPITVWILKETCNQLAHWQKVAPEYKDLVISVNISGKHLSNDDLVDDVEAALEASKIHPNALKLEITESSAMENAEHTINVLNKLKHIGVQLSIDDFGTGYSSLSYLHRLPFDTLKIDRSFVYSVGTQGENSEILQTIISLAKNLKMRVIAEGVETTSQLAVLRNLGCDYAQGFLLAKPKGREETEELLYSRRNWLPEEVSGEFERVSIPGSDDSLPVF
jgi:diguanylate cyclase (GGDEF)-like protein